MSTISAQPGLASIGSAEEQARRFHDEGYIGPFRAFSEDEMVALRGEVERVLATDPPATGGPIEGPVHNRHLDQPVVQRLATAPAIVEPMKAILGPNLLLWRTHFFVKGPGGAEIPWHQVVAAGAVIPLATEA